MKKIRYILLLIILLPINVKAAINFTCPEPMIAGTAFYCNITSTENITSFDAKMATSKINYNGALPGTGFTSSVNNTNLKFSSVDGGTNIASIQLAVPKNRTPGEIMSVSIYDIKYTIKGENKLTNDINKTYKVGSLTTITTRPTTKPTSPSSPKTFTVTLDSNNASNKKESLTCETSGSNCNIDLTKAVKPIKAGFEFVGWGNDKTCTLGNTASYKAVSNATLYACWKVNAVTPDPKPSENNDLFLNKLEIEGQVIGFSKFKTEYDLKVLYEIENLTIIAEANESIIVDISETELEVGENVITIKLTDGEGKTKDYTINVDRLKEGEIIKELSTDATLKSVSFGKFNVNFSPLVVDYTLEIDSKTTSIPVTAETTDEGATYDVSGNTDIKENDVIKITVTAEDGTTNTYNFHISVKLTFLEKNKLYIGIAGALLLLLIILLSINKSKKGGNKSGKASKVKAKKVPKKATKSIPKTSSSVPGTVPPSNPGPVEVLGI